MTKSEKWKDAEMAAELARRMRKLHTWYINSIGDEEAFKPSQVNLKHFDSALAAIGNLVHQIQVVRDAEKSNLEDEAADLLGGPDPDDERTES
jgi:hypothetical protein